MILLLDTSTALCKLTFIDGDWHAGYEWQADRGLAKGLLKYLQTKLEGNSKTWSDITAIGVFEGPGSFTGLRIGITVMNTIADANNIPIVGGRGEDWVGEVITKLNSGKNEKIILPFYGSEAHITISKK
jgi:tRNA threonylcarbamoyladenosine biosynthesis protein TsaB